MQTRLVSRIGATLLLTAATASVGAMAMFQVTLPAPLKSIPVPEPTNLDQYVADKAAAVRLGKAFFWDMQVGSDGVQSCGTCHFHAGVDSRMTNQINPDLNGGDPTFLPGAGANSTLKPGDFPFHQLADPEDPTSVVADRNDVASSQGVFLTLFVDVIPGSARDKVIQIPDPVFNVNGVKTRRVEPRNTPTVFNAIFNHRNFWDGRAQSDFNGVNPFGSRDPNARVLKVDLETGIPHWVKTDITEGASLASLATGPALSAFEMSADGRTLRKLGKKMLSLRPLGKQYVAIDDSVLGSLSRGHLAPTDRTRSSFKGLSASYKQMIQEAFRPEWWKSQTIVTDSATGAANLSTSTSEGDDDRLPTFQYTVTEQNFSLFWGLAVQLYLSTLVSDDTHFDQFVDGNTNALTPQQEAGMNLFFGKAGCVRCHVGSELTEASFTECHDERIDELDNLNGIEEKYDKGFINSGVRPFNNDLGIGGKDPFGNPLADSRRLKLGQLPGDSFNLTVGPDEPISVDGAFKIPGLRNVELSAPYFHNGGMSTLEQVVDFYNRGGDFSHLDKNNVRDFMSPLGLNGTEKAELVAFLKSLTDERVRFQKAPFDHPQIFVPNGHPGNDLAVDNDGHGRAKDPLIDIKAVGAGGGPALPPTF